MLWAVNAVADLNETLCCLQFYWTAESSYICRNLVDIFLKTDNWVYHFEFKRSRLLGLTELKHKIRHNWLTVSMLSEIIASLQGRIHRGHRGPWWFLCKGEDEFLRSLIQHTRVLFLLCIFLPPFAASLYNNSPLSFLRCKTWCALRYV